MQYSWPSNSGSALQIGGLKAEFDLSKPQGSRIINAKINGESIVLDKLYNVAMNNYIAENESYPHIASKEIVSEYGTCEQALRRYIEKNTFSEAANTPNLTPVSAEPTTESTDPTDVTEATDTTQPTDTTQAPTQEQSAATDAGTGASGAASAGGNTKPGGASAGGTNSANSTSGKVATGDSRSVIVLLVLVMAGAFIVTAAASKRKQKN